MIQLFQMSKRIQFYTPLVILFVWGACSSAVGIELFISTSGSDANSGTKEKPFQTLERARDEIRSLKASGPLKNGATVWLAEGIYERNTTFELNESDSGLGDAPIVYRALDGRQVRIMGGRRIADGYVTDVTDKAILDRIIDENAKSQIRQIKLKALGITDYGTMNPRGFRRPYVNAPMELFINGDAMHIARWPNNGSVPIGKVLDKGSVPRNSDFSNRGGKFTYNYDRPEKWKQADDIWLSGLFAYGYADDTIKVYDFNQQDKAIQLVQPHLYGLMGGKKWRAYFALNLLEEIDQPGEYYIDRNEGILYFYPPGDIKDAEICVSLLEEPMVAMEGASYVKFEGLTFEVSRGIGIYIERGSSNQIVGCTLKNIGVIAVCIGKGIKSDTMCRHNFTGTPASRELGSWHEHIYDNPCFDREGGSNHGVISCDIYNIGAGAISLGGGDRMTLTPAGNYVKNCDIHHFNRLDRSYKAGVNIDGVGNRIQNCRIHDCPNSAIYLHGNDHLIEYNEVYNACLYADDHGFFYLGRDPSERGNLLRYNFWHHSSIGPDAHGGVYGIYNDDGACSTKVYGNVFYKAAKSGVMKYGGGHDMELENCILIDCPAPISADARMKGWAKKTVEKGGLFDQRLALVKHDRPPYSQKYPKLVNYWNEDPADPKRNTFKNNIVISQDINRMNKSLNTPYVNVEDNYISKDDPGFVDIELMNFKLKENAAAYKKLPNFKPIPFEKIGLYKDRHRKEITGGYSAN